MKGDRSSRASRFHLEACGPGKRALSFVEGEEPPGSRQHGRERRGKVVNLRRGFRELSGVVKEARGQFSGGCLPTEAFEREDRVERHFGECSHAHFLEIALEFSGLFPPSLRFGVVPQRRGSLSEPEPNVTRVGQQVAGSPKFSGTSSACRKWRSAASASPAASARRPRARCARSY